jgi:phosphoenolpyruvate carboxykinase (ATP)
MASKSSSEYYSSLKEMSPIRAIAVTLMNDPKVRKLTVAEAYEMARKQPGVKTDMPVYPNLPKCTICPQMPRY